MIRTVPLNKLLPSPRNVRRTCDEQADFQLKADLEARGLLQNLVVTSVKRPRGCFAVEAGGRRLRALQALAEEAKIGKAHEICCLVIEGGSAAQEASLVENFQRLSMNPADECPAFKQLIEQGSDIESIARRFGLTVRFVEGRSRLAGLAPVIFEALGAGEISLDVAKAYAATPDQKWQPYVFEQLSRGYGAAHPDSIQRNDDPGDRQRHRPPRPLRRRGGLCHGRRAHRPRPVRRRCWRPLARHRLARAPRLREARNARGRSRARPTLDRWIGSEQTAGLQRVRLESPPPTDEESARVDDLEGKIEELVGLLEDDETGDQAKQEVEAAIRKLSDEIDAIANKPPVIDEELKPSIGTFLLLDDQGRPGLDASFYSEGPLDGGFPTDEDETIFSNRQVGTPGKTAGLSQRLVDELAMPLRMSSLIAVSSCNLAASSSS